MNPSQLPPSAGPMRWFFSWGACREASLKAGQYCPSAERLLAHHGGRPGHRRDLPYVERLAALAERRIALWDVLASCVRPGSLDSSILGSTAVLNDFSRFFRTHALIRTVFFEGRTGVETLGCAVPA